MKITKYIKHNKNIFIVAAGLFVSSMAIMAFILNLDVNKEKNEDLHASVMGVESETTPSQQYEQMETYYKSFSKGEEDPIVTLNLDGSIEFSSKEFIEQNGYKPSQMKGKSFYSLINKDDLPSFMTFFGRTIATEEPAIMIGPFKMKNSASEYKLYMSSLYPILKNEKVQKIVVTLKNIDEYVKNGPVEDMKQTTDVLKVTAPKVKAPISAPEVLTSYAEKTKATTVVTNADTAQPSVLSLESKTTFEEPNVLPAAEPKITNFVEPKAPELEPTVSPTGPKAPHLDTKANTLVLEKTIEDPKPIKVFKDNFKLKSQSDPEGPSRQIGPHEDMATDSSKKR